MNNIIKCPNCRTLTKKDVCPLCETILVGENAGKDVYEVELHKPSKKEK